MKRATASFMKESPLHWVALGGGAGLSPWAPGTVGSLLGFPLFLLLRSLPWGVQWSLLAGLFLFGIWACGATARALEDEDPKAVVWDEVVACAGVLLLAPPTGLGWMLGFGLFRLFDIWKPFPIGWVDRRIKGGVGIMLDDALAAVLAMWILWHIKGVWHGHF
ncbi:phosphatidylglycerophosphatase A family protein [Ferrovum myxofaciens]|uniref:Phosphatidylglycerophosphatase A n=2 Tax=root TaxID=1 RepID=A0A8F3DYT1_9PROT|nr:phosphatidylglycerophosphatase A [Ferrovum myxofaciens]KXW58447.1 phosphatidylglycerophosphatase A [Ferrovum myxofaciens]MBU6994498.1 phosphatidylglycerophosphatase A [Ferrovum myxofaciens]QKE38370.1 MAG: phosphatidylglycerophosphatase A [Ferrovum myxofaciens]QKE40898.1 MAG: phosphatidylglycerophosphatase A [Ferrovum myxofaciens]QWY76107.1 MAG: phosphatidylglycerophosphatase A [Ferrovum myxofaciens]